MTVLLAVAAATSGCTSDVDEARAPGVADTAAPELSRLVGALTDTVPGVTAAVATPDGVAWCGAYGWSSRELGEALPPDRLLGVGSITETVTPVIMHPLAGEVARRLDARAGSHVRRVP